MRTLRFSEEANPNVLLLHKTLTILTRIWLNIFLYFCREMKLNKYFFKKSFFWGDYGFRDGNKFVLTKNGLCKKTCWIFTRFSERNSNKKNHFNWVKFVWFTYIYMYLQSKMRGMGEEDEKPQDAGRIFEEVVKNDNHRTAVCQKAD